MAIIVESPPVRGLGDNARNLVAETLEAFETVGLGTWLKLTDDVDGILDARAATILSALRRQVVGYSVGSRVVANVDANGVRTGTKSMYVRRLVLKAKPTAEQATDADVEATTEVEDDFTV